MITRRAYASTIGDYYSLQFGLEPKETIRKRVDFAEPFGGPPISVVISPFLEGSGVHVGHAETIRVVEHDHFEIISGNHAGNYGLFWIAVGPHFFEVASGSGASNYYVSWIAIGPR